MPDRPRSMEEAVEAATRAMRRWARSPERAARAALEAAGVPELQAENERLREAAARVLRESVAIDLVGGGGLGEGRADRPDALTERAALDALRAALASTGEDNDG